MVKTNNRMAQPTAAEIHTALHIARKIGTIEAARDFQRIRERKTTWLGNNEWTLRLEVDRFLRETFIRTQGKELK